MGISLLSCEFITTKKHEWGPRAINTSGTHPFELPSQNLNLYIVLLIYKVLLALIFDILVAIGYCPF